MEELIEFLKSDDICPVCKRERKIDFYEGGVVGMCLSCYSMKVFKDFDPVEVEYKEYALNTGGKPYELNKVRKWLRKFYKDILWDGKD